MKHTVTIGLLTSLLFGLLVVACDPRLSPDPAPTGKLRILFDNQMSGTDLVLGKNTYQNAAGESFMVTKFNYFVSNLVLQKSDGNTYVVPQDSSYFLVQEDKPASQTITISNIPTNSYTGLTFTIGVDSLRSLADISKRTGVLDPALNDGMYWEWNSGYIFLKMEGQSALAPAAQNNTFFFHVGGFGGGYNGKKTINNLRTITLPFMGSSAVVSTTATPAVRVIADGMKLFNGTTTLSIAQHPSVMFDAYSTNISANYAQMFIFDRTLPAQ